MTRKFPNPFADTPWLAVASWTRGGRRRAACRFRMVESGDRLRLAIEALLHVRVAGEVRRQDLDRHRAVQARVGGLVDLAHAAGADGCDDL